MARQVVALFDFDGTVTRSDSLLPFLLQLFGPMALIGHAVLLAPTLLGYLLKFIPNGLAKERILSHLLTGMRVDELNASAQRFAEERLPYLVRKESAERIAWHQAKGHRVIIVSASLVNYLQPWATSLGITDVLATRMQEEDGRIRGGFIGLNCYGEAKVQRIREFLGDLDDVETYAYGDSAGDLPMLALADHAYYRGEIKQL